MHIDIDLLTNASPFISLLLTWLVLLFAIRFWDGNVRPRR